MKVLLIGWDAADWKIINPLLDSGKMPALERLVNNGVIANLATLDPPISPMLWTSIATGKTADKHGILGFTEPDAESGGIRPVNVTSRKVKAIWNILQSQGKKCNVVGWWPSYPAEPINGVMISNFFNKVTLKKAEDNKIDHTNELKLNTQVTHKQKETVCFQLSDKETLEDGIIYPSALGKEVFDLRVEPGELTEAHILPFVSEAAKIDQKKDGHLSAISKIISEAASIQAITTYLLENTEWDLTAVYFDSIDHFCHGFMKFYPPRMEGVEEEQFELYKNVIDSAYMFHDMMLERLVELAGKDTTVILISDHGFHTGKLRPRFLPDFSAAPIFEHSLYGIFCISGENIKKDERIHGATLLDIVPTLLTIFGLPVGRDMDGKVLTSIFEQRTTNNEQLITKYIDSWEEVEGDFGMHPSHKQVNAFESADALQQLVELGYIEEPSKDKKEAVEYVVNESQYNLSRVYLSNRKFKEAIEVLEELYKKDVNDIRFNLDLATCYLNLNNIEKAGEIIGNLRRISEKPTDQSLDSTTEQRTANNEKQSTNLRFLPNIDLLEGMLFIKKNSQLPTPDYKLIKKGLLLLKEAVKSNPRLPNIHLEIGKVYLEMEKYDEARKTFIKAISIDDSQAGAYHGLAVSLLRLNRFEEATDYALTAIGMQYHSAGAHYHLGEALYRLGKYDDAEKAFEVCLKLSPGFHKAKLWIDKIHINHSGKLETLNFKLETHNMKGEIIIVSGLPRSGTSMMMKMLLSGGIEVYHDNLRKPDNNNPEGYFEHIAVKNLQKDNSFLINADGKAIKIVSHLLYNLPDDYFYKIIYMRRNMTEVLKSQQIMLGKDPSVISASVANAFTKEIEKVDVWANKEPNVDILYINYAEIISNAAKQAEIIQIFLNQKLDIPNMVKAVNPELYRNKA